jgi:hypothetical protein
MPANWLTRMSQEEFTALLREAIEKGMDDAFEGTSKPIESGSLYESELRGVRARLDGIEYRLAAIGNAVRAILGIEQRLSYFDLQPVAKLEVEVAQFKAKM